MEFSKFVIATTLVSSTWRRRPRIWMLFISLIADLCHVASFAVIIATVTPF